MDTLFLPKIKTTSKNPIFTDQHLLVLGGRPPTLDWLRESANKRTLWAVDRGVNVIKEAGFLPDFLIGDKDSADSDAWEYAEENGVKIEKHPVEKDFTDFELSLLKLPPQSFAILTGGFGKRFDHTFSNIFSSAHAKNNLCLADEKETLFFLKDGDEYEITFDETPIAVSLLPITEKCEGVSIAGVHWSLSNVALRQSQPNAVSNVLENGNSCKVKLSRGILGVYVLHREF